MELKNKKVLVTGAGGFIGSHLVEALLRHGCKVEAFVYYNAFNSWGWLDTLPQGKLRRIKVLAGDVRDSNNVRKAIKGKDIVFHLAALIGIPYSYYSPDSYIDTNIKGTFNILQASRDFDVQKIVVTSTSEVYGTAKYVPIDEEHPLRGQSPYSATKIGGDKMGESFYHSFNTPVVIARPFNTYGPRQSARAVIPTIITQALSSTKEIKLGNLFPTRDLTYVDDVCEGIIEIVKSDKVAGRTINICSGMEISIGDLARLILRLMDSRKKIVLDPERKRPRKSEVERLFGDNSLIRTVTNWRPRYSLEEGVKKTIDWFIKTPALKQYKSTLYNI